MTDTVAPGRSRLSRGWNDLVQRNRLVRFVDDWWFERARIPATVIASATELSVYFVGLVLLPLPGFVVLSAARLASMLNEGHTMALAIRNRELSLFNQPQTWLRNPDGSLARRPGFSSRDAEEVAVTPRGNILQRVVGGVAQAASDFWTERKRLPGFVFGLASPICAFALGAIFHAPIALVAGITYLAIIAQTAPQIRNGALSFYHRTLDYFDKPQTIIRGRPRHPKAVEASPEAEGPAAVSAVEDVGPATVSVAPVPATPPPIAPVPTVGPAQPRLARLAPPQPPLRVAASPPIRSLDL